MSESEYNAQFFNAFPSPATAYPPPPFVGHESTKKIKNDVNITVRVELDDKKPNTYFVSFTFDANVDGRITILYFAKEEANCTFNPLYRDIEPVRIPFQKGLGQHFRQTSGTGIDLGIFEADDLLKQFPGDDVFPLVIIAESGLQSRTIDKQPTEPLVAANAPAQITEAVLEKNNEGHFHVKISKQILWVGVRYELGEIFGISNSDEGTNNNGSGNECAICMNHRMDTAVMPCRHMCLCSGCAQTLWLRSNTCPICRQPIHKLFQIKRPNEHKNSPALP